MAVQKARVQVAQLLKAPSAESILFTSGATESIHMALVGWTLKQTKPCHIITSPIEHKATYGACSLAEKLGARTSQCAVQKDGTVLAEDILALVKRDEPTLVSLIHGNNEIGTVQDIERLAKKIKEQKNVFFHVDAAQSIGKVAIDLANTEIDFLSLSGHKIYGPKGIGALYLRDAELMEPLFTGGGQEMNLRAGTHNVPAIVGLGKACEWFAKNGEAETQRLLGLQKLFVELLTPLREHIEFHGSWTQRLPNNVHFSLKKRNLSTLPDLIESVAFSSGSACSSQNNREPSHVLQAISIPAEQARNAIRIGMGLNTTEAEVKQFCKLLSQSL
jgi:cysteine desulfurase